MDTAFTEAVEGDFCLYRGTWRRVNLVNLETGEFNLGSQDSLPITVKFPHSERLVFFSGAEVDAAKRVLIDHIRTVMPRSKVIIGRLEQAWPLDFPFLTRHGRFGDLLDDFIEDTAAVNPQLAEIIAKCVRGYQ